MLSFINESWSEQNMKWLQVITLPKVLALHQTLSTSFVLMRDRSDRNYLLCVRSQKLLWQLVEAVNLNFLTLIKEKDWSDICSRFGAAVMANSAADINRDTKIIPTVLKTRAKDSRALTCFKLFSHADLFVSVCNYSTCLKCPPRHK